MSTEMPDQPTSATSSSMAASSSSLMWSVGMVLAAIISFLVLQFFPWQFSIPQEMLDEVEGNPMALTALESKMAPELEWNNGLLRLSIVGAIFGFVPMVLGGRRNAGSRIAFSLIAMLIGGLFGAASLFLTDALATGVSESNWARTDDGSPTMIVEMLKIGVLSTLILLPACGGLLLSSVENSGQKALAVPVAGVLTGLALPLVATLAFPELRLEQIPPATITLTAMWLGLMSIFGILLPKLTGDKKKTKTAPLPPAG